MNKTYSTFLVAAFFAMSGCGADIEYGPSDQPGPFGVGVTTIFVPDQSVHNRELPVEIWYPAKIQPDATPETYEIKIGGLVAASWDSMAGAVRDAELDDRDGPYPVVVFSHGNGGVRTQSVYLTEHLVSHGFIVVAPDHVGNTFADQALGSTIPVAEMIVIRPSDITATIDGVLDFAADPQSVIYSALDESRIGIAGHSFGGFTSVRIAGATADPAVAIEFCTNNPDVLFCQGFDPNQVLPVSQRDNRVIAALPQTPAGYALFGASDGIKDIAVPMMIQGGNADSITPFTTESQAIYNDLLGDAALLGIDKAGHFTFSDACRLADGINTILADRPEIIDFKAMLDSEGCGATNVPYDTAHVIINDFATAFFHTYVAGRAGFEDKLVPATPLQADVFIHDVH